MSYSAPAKSMQQTDSVLADKHLQQRPLTPQQQSHPIMSWLDPIKDTQAVDLTAFVGQWPSRLHCQANIEELSAMADSYKLDRLFVSHIASVFGYDTRLGNEELLKECQQDPRLAPTIILNPTNPTWEQELDWAAANGAAAVRFIPGYHHYSLRDERAMQCFEAIRAYRLPLHINQRLQDERLYHPSMPIQLVPQHELAEWIQFTSGHPLVISGIRPTEWEQLCLLMNDGATVDHVLIDLWFVNGPLAVIAELYHNNKHTRYGYGSCYPLQTPEATILQICKADIPETARKQLFSGNAQNILGIQPNSSIAASRRCPND